MGVALVSNNFSPSPLKFFISHIKKSDISHIKKRDINCVEFKSVTDAKFEPSKVPFIRLLPCTGINLKDSIPLEN